VTIVLTASLASDLAVLFHAALKAPLSSSPAVFGNLFARIVLPPRWSRLLGSGIRTTSEGVENRHRSRNFFVGGQVCAGIFVLARL